MLLFKMIRTSLLSICLLVLLCENIARANADELPPILIVELKTKDAGTEFVRLFNTTESDISLTGWSIVKKSKSCQSISNIASKTSLKGKIIRAKSFFTLAPEIYVSELSADMAYSNASTSLTASNTVIISNEYIVIDKVGYTDACDAEGSPVQGSPLTHIQRKKLPNDSYVDTDQNDQDFTILDQKPIPDPADPTPNPSPEPQVAQPNTVRVNELLPNPTNGQEFIELFNFGTETIDLKGWSLKDNSKTGRFVFDASAPLAPGAFLALSNDNFSFALNNDEDAVTLFNTQEEKIDSVSYTSGKKGVSYGFSDTGFRWSAFPTPGAENRFGNEPQADISLPKTIYEKTPATFEAKSDESLRFVWDFGDGHSSRLAKVNHTYEKTGNFSVKLSLSSEAETVLKTFLVSVKKTPKSKVSIVELNPNPKGSDKDGEWITLTNHGKKSVSLKNWSIAVGPNEEKLVNHPIRTKVKIRSGETVRLSRQDAAFSLPNTQGFVTLRRPDKKIAASVQYYRPQGVEENERYRKEKGDWIWETPENAERSASADAVDESEAESAVSPDSEGNIANANTLLNLIDTLSADELEILQNHIEAKKKLLQSEQNAASIERENTVASSAILPNIPPSNFPPEIKNKQSGNSEMFDRYQSLSQIPPVLLETIDSSFAPEAKDISQESSESARSANETLLRTLNGSLGTIFNAIP